MNTPIPGTEKINCLICGGSARHTYLGFGHGLIVCDVNPEHVADPATGKFYTRTQEDLRDHRLDWASYHVRFANGLD